jgi:cellulose synthase/poly-beta-1,6-N-acetylglucosamine synthase-like glycosyltransferase
VTAVAVILVLLPPALFVYAYFGYPLILRILSGVPVGSAAGNGSDRREDSDWPPVSISLPAYNEEARLAGTLDALLALDYPPHRLEIVVVSDASSDRTDEIASGYADRGVRLLRLPERGGKVAAENYAASRLTHGIVVNTDATIRIPPEALKPLIRAFDDPAVGVASGRDVSVASVEDEANQAESGYVGYEMKVRSLETGAGGIVGASGCFYAILRELHEPPFPPHLSRDFASCLNAREAGYRSVSVDEAICFVPRTGSLEREYRRKVRTMARGLATLWFKRSLLNPFRYGRFAWMLWSHKLARWLVPLMVPVAVAALAGLAWSGSRLAAVLLALSAAGTLAGFAAWRWAERSSAPGPVASLGYAFAANFAGIAAWWQFLVSGSQAVWEPTRRA